MVDQVLEFLKNNKEVLAVLISVVSATIAVGSAVFSFRQRAHEGKRALRSQLIDTISKLIEFEGQAIELNYEIERGQNSPTEDRALRSKRNVLSEQRRAIAELAVFIFNELGGSKVADVEYATVARAFAAASDPEQASYYWNQAINMSNQTTYRTKLLGMYGDFLFGIDQKHGREKYSAAENTIDKNASPRVRDLICWEKVHILSRWAVREARVGSKENFEAIFERARVACGSITDSNLRRQGEQNILPLARKEIDEATQTQRDT